MENKPIIFLATGDIGMNRPDPDSIFNYVRPELSKADLLFGQLEPCLADTGSPASQCRLPMRGDPAGGRAIRNAGYDVISFATNHCMDWGREAFFQTLDVIKGNGMSPLGAGKNLEEARRPVIKTVGDVRFGFLGYNSILPQDYWATDERPGCVPMRAHTVYQQIEHDQPGTPCRIHTFAFREDMEAMKEDIKKLRSQVDVLIMSIHWGIHFIPAVLADYQRDVAHAAIDAGADLILGHHSHILKPVEIYKDKVIFYSLANFALDPPQAFDPNLNEKESHKQMMSLNSSWKAHGKNMPEDSYKTILCRCVVKERRISDVVFQPVSLDADSTPRILNPSDIEFNNIINYMREITADQNLSTRYETDGKYVRPR